MWSAAVLPALALQAELALQIALAQAARVLAVAAAEQAVRVFAAAALVLAAPAAAIAVAAVSATAADTAARKAHTAAAVGLVRQRYKVADEEAPPAVAHLADPIRSPSSGMSNNPAHGLPSYQ